MKDHNSTHSSNANIVRLIIFIIGLLGGSSTHYVFYKKHVTKDSSSVSMIKSVPTQVSKDVKNDNGEKVYIDMLHQGVRMPGVVNINQIKSINHPNQSTQHQNSHLQIKKTSYHTTHGLNTILKMGDFGASSAKRYRPLSLILSNKISNKELQINFEYTKDGLITAKLCEQYGVKELRSVSAGPDGIVIFDGLNIDGISKLTIELFADPNKGIESTDSKYMNSQSCSGVSIKYDLYSGTAEASSFEEQFRFGLNGSLLLFRCSGVKTNLQRGIAANLCNGTWESQELADGSVGLVNIVSPNEVAYELSRMMTQHGIINNILKTDVSPVNFTAAQDFILDAIPLMKIGDYQTEFLNILNKYSRKNLHLLIGEKFNLNINDTSTFASIEDFVNANEIPTEMSTDVAGNNIADKIINYGIFRTLANVRGELDSKLGFTADNTFDNLTQYIGTMPDMQNLDGADLGAKIEAYAFAKAFDNVRLLLDPIFGFEGANFDNWENYLGVSAGSSTASDIKNVAGANISEKFLNYHDNLVRDMIYSITRQYGIDVRDKNQYPFISDFIGNDLGAVDLSGLPGANLTSKIRNSMLGYALELIYPQGDSDSIDISFDASGNIDLAYAIGSMPNLTNIPGSNLGQKIEQYAISKTLENVRDQLDSTLGFTENNIFNDLGTYIGFMPGMQHVDGSNLGAKIEAYASSKTLENVRDQLDSKLGFTGRTFDNFIQYIGTMPDMQNLDGANLGAKIEEYAIFRTLENVRNQLDNKLGFTGDNTFNDLSAYIGNMPDLSDVEGGTLGEKISTVLNSSRTPSFESIRDELNRFFGFENNLAQNLEQYIGLGVDSTGKNILSDVFGVNVFMKFRNYFKNEFNTAIANSGLSIFNNLDLTMESIRHIIGNLPASLRSAKGDTLYEKIRNQKNDEIFTNLINVLRNTGVGIPPHMTDVSEENLRTLIGNLPDLTNVGGNTLYEKIVNYVKNEINQGNAI